MNLENQLIWYLLCLRDNFGDAYLIQKYRNLNVKKGILMLREWAPRIFNCRRVKGTGTVLSWKQMKHEIDNLAW